MQLTQLMQSNLFNELSDQEQEVVAGGADVFRDSGAWGSVERVVDGLNGSWTYTAPNGTKSIARWGPAVTNGFSYTVVAAWT